jgi:hypothetical protein
VQYAKVPTVGFRSVRGLLGLALVIGTLVGVIFLPKQFFFPALMGYVLYGIGQTVLLGLLERLPGSRDGDDSDDEGDLEEVERAAAKRERRRRRRLRSNPARPDTPEDPSA